MRPKTVYLAGSLDTAVGAWRDDVTAVLSEHYTDDRLFVLDPRTDRLMGTTLSKEDLANFESIVFDWRMRAVQLADQVVFWFAEGTRAPDALIELGIVHLKGPQLVVGCEPRFWQFPQVARFCQRFQIPFKTDLADIGVLARYRL